MFIDFSKYYTNICYISKSTSHEMKATNSSEKKGFANAWLSFRRIRLRLILELFIRCLNGYARTVIFGSWNNTSNPNDIDVVFEFTTKIPNTARIMASAFQFVGVDANFISTFSNARSYFTYASKSNFIKLTIKNKNTVDSTL